MLGLGMSLTGQAARRSGGGSSSHVIVSITDDGSGRCLFTTAAPHGRSANDVLVVAGNSVSGYNTTHEVASAPTDTTFTTDQSYISDGTGGTWALA